VAEAETLTLILIPCLPFELAAAMVEEHHRHSVPPPRLNVRFCIGAALEGEDALAAAAIVGRPNARHLDDGWTAEVLRLVARPGAPLGACSALYAAAWRAWRAMGGLRIVTYTLATESGASLRGAGWTRGPEAGGQQWTCPARPRERREIFERAKWRWERTLWDPTLELPPCPSRAVPGAAWRRVTRTEDPEGSLFPGEADLSDGRPGGLTGEGGNFGEAT